MHEGEIADLGADAAQAVEARGREIFGEPEWFEQDGFGRGDFGGSGPAVTITEQGKQAAHERGIGVAAEVATAIAQFAHDPGEGDAAFHAVGLGAFGFGQRRAGARTVDDGGEAFLRILDDGEILDHLLLFFGEGHDPGNCLVSRRLASRRVAVSTGRMVNPFAISWLWRGFRGRSVTFALLFATCVLGWPLSAQVNHLLTRLGVHWLYAMLLPAFFFMWLAKREDRIIADEAKRKLWARGLIAGSLVLAAWIGWLRR